MKCFTRLVVLVLATLVVEGSGSCCDCLTFWTAFGSNCYRYFGQRVDLKQARQNCRSHGSDGKFAYLASIHSQDEQDYLSALARSYTDYSEGTYWHVWIGLNDEEEEADFVWTDKSDVNYTSWAPGQTDGTTSQQGVIMYFTAADGDGLWHDVSTTRTFNYVCKMSRCIKHH